MNDFVFQSPTKIYFGKSKENEIGKIIKRLTAVQAKLEKKWFI